MIITSTGYFATGSSAVYVLLKEYRTCSTGKINERDYEHVSLYCPNGLFDLEDKLLIGNNIHRSDEALDSFLNTMRWLYKNNFLWFGDYKRICGRDFLQNAEEFVEAITDVKVYHCNWYYDYIKSAFSFKHFVKNCLLMPFGRQHGDFCNSISFKNRDTICYSYPESDDFFKYAHEYVQRHIASLSTEEDKNLILDHFLLPNNLFRIPKYFSEDEIRVIVVERDPRDVYMTMVLEREQTGVSPCVPIDVNEFIVFWKKLRKTEKRIEDPRILRIQFEDLLYHFEDVKEKIEEFCGLNSEDRISPFKYFDPEGSKKNTKQYEKCTRYCKEIQIIEQNLGEYLYSYDE